jgi:hypothetical protein
VRIRSLRTARTGAVALLVLASLALGVGTAGAITFGQPDGDRHPNVGALLADWDPDSAGPDILCSGTLIARRSTSPPHTARRSWSPKGSRRSG